MAKRNVRPSLCSYISHHVRNNNQDLEQKFNSTLTVTTESSFKLGGVAVDHCHPTHILDSDFVFRVRSQTCQQEFTSVVYLKFFFRINTTACCAIADLVPAVDTRRLGDHPLDGRGRYGFHSYFASACEEGSKLQQEVATRKLLEELKQINRACLRIRPSNTKLLVIGKKTRQFASIFTSSSADEEDTSLVSNPETSGNAAVNILEDANGAKHLSDCLPRTSVSVSFLHSTNTTGPDTPTSTFDGQHLDQLFGIDSDEVSKPATDESVQIMTVNMLELANRSNFFAEMYNRKGISDVLKNKECDIICRENYQVLFTKSSKETAGFDKVPMPESGQGKTKENILNSSKTQKPRKGRLLLRVMFPPSSPEPNENPDKMPDKDQLRALQDYLAEDIPQAFDVRHNFQFYADNLVFENNYPEEPYTVIGTQKFFFAFQKMRFYFLLKYATVRIKVLGSTIDETEGSVCLHIQAKALTQLGSMKFWKYSPSKFNQSMDDESDFYEFLATYYLNRTGLVYKLRVDKMMIDRNYEPAKKKGIKALGFT